jgi:hypothetical protein
VEGRDYIYKTGHTDLTLMLTEYIHYANASIVPFGKASELLEIG